MKDFKPVLIQMKENLSIDLYTKLKYLIVEEDKNPALLKLFLIY
jgi:hypothetical protein